MSDTFEHILAVLGVIVICTMTCVVYFAYFSADSVVEVCGVLGGVEVSGDRVVLLIDGSKHYLSKCNWSDVEFFKGSVGSVVSFTYKRVGENGSNRLLSVGGQASD